MKVISKFILVGMVVLSTVAVHAQGLQLGYVNSKTLTTIDGSTASTNLDGIQAGLNYKMEVQGPVSLQYGLLYSYLFKNDEILSVDYKTRAHVLDIPVHLAMDFPLTDNVNAFVSAGPDFSYALSNKTTADLPIVGETTANLYGDDSDYSRFNMQLGVCAGVSLNKVVLKFGYHWGVIDLNKADNIKVKGNTLSASIGYNF
jgi:hypothetical protein